MQGNKGSQLPCHLHRVVGEATVRNPPSRTASVGPGRAQRVFLLDWTPRTQDFRPQSASKHSRNIQRVLDDSKNETCVFEGVWAWCQRETLSKKAVFLGKRHNNQVLKHFKMYCQKLLSLRRLKNMLTCLECSGVAAVL